MRFGRLFYIIVLLVCVFELVRLWGIAPEQMAAHFNIEGNADRFVPKLDFFWFQLQTLGIVLLVSFVPQALFLVLPSTLINMPNREYWLAPERRDETLNRLSSFGAIVFGVILLVVQVAFELSVYANLRTPIFFHASLMIPVMVAAFFLVVFMLVGLIASFRIPASADS